MVIDSVVVDVPWMRQKLEEFFSVARRSLDARRRGDFSFMSELRKREFASRRS